MFHTTGDLAHSMSRVIIDLCKSNNWIRYVFPENSVFKMLKDFDELFWDDKNTLFVKFCGDTYEEAIPLIPCMKSYEMWHMLYQEVYRTIFPTPTYTG